MLKPRDLLLSLLMALAGCSTPSRPQPGQRVFPKHPRIEPTPALRQERTDQPVAATSAPPVTAPVPPAPPASALTLARTNNYGATWIPLDRWSRENQIGVLTALSPPPSPKFALTTSNGVMVVQANSLVAKWTGLEFHLGFEPQLVNGQLFVHRLDLKKNIEPLIAEARLSGKGKGIIVIDPGHGGSNLGTKSVADGIYEKEFTLDWARRLEALLSTNGWQVFLTRTNDMELALSNRVAFAEEHKADLFISLHFNSAAPSQEQAGLETFCLTPSGMPSTLTRGYEDDSTLVFTNNAFDVDNLLYALRLHRALLKQAELADRGLRRARFLGVLRGQNRPAVLVEGGYLSNPEEARRIGDPAYREKLAMAVAEALGEPRAIAPESPLAASAAGLPPATTNLQPVALPLEVPDDSATNNFP